MMNSFQSGIRIFSCGLFLFLTSIIYLQAQEWKDYYHFNPAQTLNKLKFLNARTGFTAGSLYNGSTKNIHVTHDGGKSWTDVSSGYTSMRFMGIYILDSSTIFMSGNDGIIIRSTDGGQSWQTMNSGTTEQLWGICFVNHNLGFAVGSNGILIKSINGGSDWETIPTGINNLFYDVFFTSKGIGFASGSNVLLKTLDFGDHWSAITDFPFTPPADWIRSIKMITDQTGYACADIGRIYKTIDGGDHWFRLPSITQEALFDLDFTDELNGMICGFNGTILSTNDGGQNWTQLINPISNEIFYSINLISNDIGYICTHTGHILKLDLSTGIADKFQENISYFAYPNPCSDKVYLEFPLGQENSIQNIELCNINGNCTSIKSDKEIQFSFDMSNQLSGLHYFRIKNSGTQVTIPILIQKQ